MPAKLQVDESFAFLFMCIEASGCKIDFKLVGDATDLQPAAARMRYTRLKKAVESGHFKGAILTHPTQTSAQLAAMANPASQRLATGLENNQSAKNENLTTYHQHFSHREADASYSDEVGEEEEEEIEEEDEVEVGQEEGTSIHHTPAATQHRPKRKASIDLVDNSAQDLFYPDTSVATRKAKQIKRSDSDEESEGPEPDDEDDVDYHPSNHTRQRRRTRIARTRPRASSSSHGTNEGSSAPNKQISLTQTGSANNAGHQIQRPQVVRSFNEFSQAMRESYPAKYASPKTPQQLRQSPARIAPQYKGSPHPKQHAQSVSQAPYAVGIVSGEVQPTQEDFSFAAATGQHPMRLVSAVHHQHNKHSNRDSLASQPNDSFVATHYSPSLSPNQLQQPFSHSSHQAQHKAGVWAPRNDATVSRYHPASVFDGFQPPAVSPFATPSPITKRNVSMHTLKGQTLTQQPGLPVSDDVLDPQLRSTSVSPYIRSSPGLHTNQKYTPFPHKGLPLQSVNHSENTYQSNSHVRAEHSRPHSQVGNRGTMGPAVETQAASTLDNISHVEAHGTNDGNMASPKGRDREEQHQNTREHDASDQSIQTDRDSTQH